jgi:hypothetical protein
MLAYVSRQTLLSSLVNDFAARPKTYNVHYRINACHHTNSTGDYISLRSRSFKVANTDDGHRRLVFARLISIMNTQAASRLDPRCSILTSSSSPLPSSRTPSSARMITRAVKSLLPDMRRKYEQSSALKVTFAYPSGQ